MIFTKKTLAASIAVAATASMMASAAQAEISDGEVRIGYLADMSGTYRDLAGPGGQTAMEMAVADFGGSVNGAPIVIFSADDRNSADVGANTVREWIDQRNVDMVGGLVASSVTIAVTRVLEENNGLGI
ncbi:MAG: ABC transporter substrate-binding protein, partial [Halomonas sp.]|nr:ABC transporter substrate-binding protein [Halomonas sp.]